ncbi:MAG: tRNA uridine-5-carboxymethylaminomethyl(34) synthesis GTPase MnmE [bacterium]
MIPKFENDTIGAISTPPGEGGIAVIRMSGPRAVFIVQKVFRGKGDVSLSASHTAHHGWIFDRSESIDEVVVTVFRAPNSYTGEDVVEVSCHGGTFVGRCILELFIRNGARLANPGEFTQRGFLNGKMDLSQAEAVADLIRAKTEASRRVAAYQLEGRLSERLAGMREMLIKACSYLEAELDFSEEDAVFISREELVQQLRSIRCEFQTLLQSYDRGRACREGIRMVIVGRPNVGKSSILNSLLERERAIVSEMPGTTRDTIEDVLDIEGLLFIVTDTAGLSKVENPIEKEGVRRTEMSLEKADLVLFVLDGSQPLMADDEAIVRRLKKLSAITIPCINKIDLKQKIDIHKVVEWMPETEAVKVSALKREGIPRLIAALKATALCGGLPEEGEVVLTRMRHRDLIARAQKYILQAEFSIKKEMSQEFIALDLRGALDALGEITGQTTADDLLSRIFSDFCIGK